MHYDIIVIENPVYEEIVTLLYKYNIFCGVTLAGDTRYVFMVRYK